MVDEKRRIQALSRTQRPLPMKAGYPRTRTHNYRRNGTACLMVALDVATGKVVGRMIQRHRSREFISFLDHMVEGIDPTVDVHVILDNVSSHKSAEVREWLERHPRWTFHFTPTSASWTNAVEGIFSRLTRQRPPNAVFESPDECISAVEARLEYHNENGACAFRWSRKSEEFVASRKRDYQLISNE